MKRTLTGAALLGSLIVSAEALGGARALLNMPSDLAVSAGFALGVTTTIVQCAVFFWALAWLRKG